MNCSRARPWLVSAPAAPDALYAGTRDEGVLKSLDGGATCGATRGATGWALIARAIV